MIASSADRRASCVVWLLGIALLLGAATSLYAATDGTGEAEWPTFRGNPAQTGVATCDLPDRLVQLWAFESKEPVASTAAIAHGTVYVGTMTRLFALSAK